MTLNEVLIKQNFISKIILKKDKAELSKELKVKIMSARIQLSKIRKEFDEDVQEALKEFKPEHFDELSAKLDKSEEEKKELEAMVTKINEEYDLFITEQGKKEVVFNLELTDDEFNQLVEVNADNDVEIGGTNLQATDFLEVIYNLFVV